ncbi:MAG: class I SAM-dependent methyltransferase [Bacteroidota bacterium]|nr:class I SAM-dependent methyltransferase [Bacteroidota bacterium]
MVNINIKSKINLYEAKSSEYYQRLNPAVVSLLQPEERMLEVGCGDGTLGKISREKNLFREIYGIEIHAPSAKIAKSWSTQIFTSDIEGFDLSKVPEVNAIVCADVLEHLIDPWSLLNKLTQKLHNNGYILLSIPNARHIRVWGGLVFKGRFDYQTSGVLDKGHLRFFTLANLKELFELNNLYIDQVVCNVAPKGKLFNLLSLGLLKEFFTFQYVFRLRRKN